MRQVLKVSKRDYALFRVRKLAMWVSYIGGSIVATAGLGFFFLFAFAGFYAVPSLKCLGYFALAVLSGFIGMKAKNVAIAGIKKGSKVEDIVP